MHPLLPVSAIAVFALILAGCDARTPAGQGGTLDHAPIAQPQSADSVDVGRAEQVPPAGVVVHDWTPEELQFSLDHCAVDSVNGVVAEVGSTFQASSQETITLEGWIASPDLTSPERFTIYFRGPVSRSAETGTGVSRPDVAGIFSTPALEHAGYRLELPAGSLQAGSYELYASAPYQSGLVYCNLRHSLQVQ